MKSERTVVAIDCPDLFLGISIAFPFKLTFCEYQFLNLKKHNDFNCPNAEYASTYGCVVNSTRNASKKQNICLKKLNVFYAFKSQIQYQFKKKTLISS